MGYSLVLLQVTLKRQPNNSSPQNRLNEIYADFRSLSGGSFLLFSRAANHYVCILINALHLSLLISNTAFMFSQLNNNATSGR